MTTRERTNTVILDDWNDVYRTRPLLPELERHGPVRIHTDPLPTEAALLESLADADVVILNRLRSAFHTRYLDDLPKLRVLCQTGAVSPSIDQRVAGAAGVALTSSAGHPAGADAVAELAIGFMLALARQLPQYDRGVRNGDWTGPTTPVLRGKTMGVLGLGRIGTKVANIGRALGMEVIAWGPTLDADRAGQHGVELVTLPAALHRSDALFVCTRLSDRTRNLIDADMLTLMKPTAWLINTARGPIVNEEALLEALRARRIGGAALDVFDEEPLPPDHPLTELDNVILTPHIGWTSTENSNAYADGALRAVLQVLAGDLTDVVNAASLTQRTERAGRVSS